MACLCLEHVCRGLLEQNRMPKNSAFVKSVVTTELFQTIAEGYQLPCFDVLTGFKYIAEQIHKWEQEKNGHQFIFGGEESYGYLLGTQARDKDAIVSSALICDVALYAKRQGKTLIDLMDEIYQKYGVFYEKLLSIKFDETKEGRDKMAHGVEQIRKTPPKEIGGVPVVTYEDFQSRIKLDLATRKTTPITLPKTDMLIFWLADKSKVTIRPSGTEPKIKIYCGVVIPEFSTIDQALSQANAKADGLLKAIESHLKK
jgi:phosphoglucomutase/phosphomannomutase